MFVLKFVWLFAFAVAFTALAFFVTDTRRAYDDMLSSMQRYVTENPDTLIIEENSGLGLLNSGLIPETPDVTRDAPNLIDLGNGS